jgi:hypothetical protein
MYIILTLIIFTQTSLSSQEIIDLRTELALLRKEKEQELQSNLLTYIQALPAEELTEISNINPQMRDAIGETFI